MLPPSAIRIRFADEDRQISDAELEALFRARRRDYSAWEMGDSLETVSDADEQRLRKIIKNGNESGRINYEFTDSRAILSKLGLICPETGHLNNAGRMLFSANRPILLKTAVYATETGDTFIKLNHFEGNIFECIDEGISFVMSTLNWNVRFTGSARRVEEPEIPARALREIIVNAFAHGSYESNTAFSLLIFSNRVEIYSPGSFPIGLKPENFAEKSVEPIMMNPRIISVLFKASVIESFGSGFERTFAACREASVDYSYEEIKSGFRFIFMRKRRSGTTYEMSGSEKLTYNLLRDCDYLTNAQMAEQMNRSEKTVYRAIKTLKEQGYLERVGSDKNGYWKIIK